VAEDEDAELTPGEEQLRAMAQQVRVGERPLP
jgi:membrane protein